MCVLEYDKLLTRDLLLSFGKARVQKVQLLQHLSLHLYNRLLSVILEGSRPAVVWESCLHNDCHLHDCWPLAGHEEELTLFSLASSELFFADILLGLSVSSGV